MVVVVVVGELCPSDDVSHLQQGRHAIVAVASVPTSVSETSGLHAKFWLKHSLQPTEALDVRLTGDQNMAQAGAVLLLP